MNLNDWKTILDEEIPGVARVWVYDKGHTSSIGRYIISKIMRLANGKVAQKRSYYFQRPAAIAYARRFLKKRQALLHRPDHVPFPTLSPLEAQPSAAPVPQFQPFEPSEPSEPIFANAS